MVMGRLTLVAVAFTVSASNAFSILEQRQASSLLLTGRSTVQSPGTSMTTLYMSEGKKGSIFDAIGNFFEELDAFVDDATSRRLGNGANFYGKRKSGYYGATDTKKKQDKNTPDPLEDYQGPSKSGYFRWVPDEDGNLKPVTLGKGQNIERNPAFWDKAFSADLDKADQEPGQSD